MGSAGMSSRNNPFYKQHPMIIDYHQYAQGNYCLKPLNCLFNGHVSSELKPLSNENSSDV